MSKRDKKKAGRSSHSDKDDIESKTLGQVISLKSSTLKSVWGITLFVVAAFFLFAAFNMGGLVGLKLYSALHTLLGYGYYLVPCILLLLSISFFGDQERTFPLSKAFGTILFVISGLALFDLISPESGGIIGRLIASPLLTLFDYAVSVIALVALLIISVIIIYDAALRKEHVLFWKLFKKEVAEDEVKKSELTAAEAQKFDNAEKGLLDKAKTKGQDMSDTENPKTGSVLDGIKGKIAGAGISGSKGQASDEFADSQVIPMLSKNSPYFGKEFVPPPLSLLENDRGKPGVGDIKANANIIKRTLQNFGIDVEMDEVSIGPSVTRYALKPAEGVKLSKILGLQNNLSLALAAHPIRIEAPIPGKSLVGIEIPNSIKTTVGLGTLLAHDDYQKSPYPLLVALGKGISGKSYFENLAKMPHLLIAGTTGSGKSATIHAIITSLLFRNSADNMRFIMIDPKRVELTQYNKIPHLLTPVITEAKKAILSLKWAAKEMDRRYDILEKNSVRDITSYHKNIVNPMIEKKKNDGFIAGEVAIDPMPFIIIVIDELADIMQTYPRELEAGIVRLAQMSRAVGIHLILSTQRPSVNVITGLIKANVPARLALQVASQIDSRTILDMRGAEELLGAGDMLYLSSEKPTAVRIQSAYITEKETKNIVQYLIDNMSGLPTEIAMTGEAVTSGKPDPIFSSSMDSAGGFGDDEDVDDDLYEEAKQTVIEAGKASTSYIQRKLRVGYARAARLIDILEQKGIIGPGDGAKPREILIGRDSSSAGGSNENDGLMQDDSGSESDEGSNESGDENRL